MSGTDLPSCVSLTGIWSGAGDDSGGMLGELMAALSLVRCSVGDRCRKPDSVDGDPSADSVVRRVPCTPVVDDEHLGIGRGFRRIAETAEALRGSKGVL